MLILCWMAIKANHYYHFFFLHYSYMCRAAGRVTSWNDSFFDQTIRWNLVTPRSPHKQIQELWGKRPADGAAPPCKFIWFSQPRHCIPLPLLRPFLQSCSCSVLHQTCGGVMTLWREKERVWHKGPKESRAGRPTTLQGAAKLAALNCNCCC